MVKKARKKENQKLALAQAQKNHAKFIKKRDLHDIPAPKVGASFAHIKNKQKRSQMVWLQKTEKKKIKSKTRRAKREAEARGEEVIREVPRTVDSMREADETIVPPDDSEVEGDEAFDEFENYFKGDSKPKILVTTQQRPSRKCYDFLKELVCVIPNMFYYPRKDFKVKQICSQASERGFTDVMLFIEKRKILTGVYMCHLPHGPTSFWRLTRLKLGAEMKGGATCNASHNPELILNNFTTRLGRRIGRQLAALFPQNPDFQGRRSVTFHNQRDFVFFRHYRYNFKEKEETDDVKCRLQEIGPRFTLKCRWLQHGTFDSKAGEYEFIWRPDSQVGKKKMFV